MPKTTWFPGDPVIGLMARDSHRASWKQVFTAQDQKLPTEAVSTAAHMGTAGSERQCSHYKPYQERRDGAVYPGDGDS